MKHSTAHMLVCNNPGFMGILHAKKHSEKVVKWYYGLVIWVSYQVIQYTIVSMKYKDYVYVKGEYLGIL